MLFDGVPFAQAHAKGDPDLRNRSIDLVFSFLEEKFGVTINYDARDIPFGQPGLIEAFKFAQKLQEHGVIRSFSPSTTFPDEPPLSLWNAVCADKKNSMVGGGAWKNDMNALMATLAEGLERYIWWEEHDHFVAPVRAPSRDMKKYGAYLSPERFAGFSADQRNENPLRKFDDSTSFLWTRGVSLVTGKRTYLPAQTVSGLQDKTLFGAEPLIRQRITIGLATWPTKAGALLAGALEIIEREAYMVMWLNQLTLPRISLEQARLKSATLSGLLDSCQQYGFTVHAIKLLTDAPTHAVCAVIEDRSGHAPRFAFGLKAHRSLAYAIEKAITEALRARLAHRRHFASNSKKWDPETPVEKIGHVDRIFYWGMPENAKKLEPLLAGKIETVPEAVWEHDTTEEQLARVVDWCKRSGFECVSVPLGASKKNPTSLSIEMVVIPELEPTHLNEHLKHLGGERWRSVPEHFGLKARSEPFFETPHPFA